MNVLGRFAGVAVALLLLAGCSADPVEISEVRVSPDDTKLGLLLDLCGAVPEVEVDEASEIVTISVHEGERKQSGNDCQTEYVVELAAPLANRAVVDGSTGDEVTVGEAGSGYDWTPGLHT